MFWAALDFPLIKGDSPCGRSFAVRLNSNQAVIPDIARINEACEQNRQAVIIE
jgi:hypothetical protein